MTNILRDPSFSDSNLIWIDMEMTGLQPEVNRVIEIAAIITDAQLNILHEGPVIAVHQSPCVMSHMDSWNTQTHTKSGLVDRVLASTNTVGQDRRFMARWMPRLESFFHYRTIDVSSIKELARRWKPEAVTSFQKSTRHEALSDIQESIDELKHYRKTVLNM